MENKTFYQEILLDHNRNPAHKHTLPDAELELEGVNPSCGDDIVLQLKIENGMVADGAFHGNGCAISQASADMMLDLVIGKTKEEAGRAAEQHICLCRNEDLLLPDEKVEELSEAEFGRLPGFELRFGQTEHSFLVGFNRFAESEPMYGWLEVSGKPVIAG